MRAGSVREAMRSEELEFAKKPMSENSREEPLRCTRKRGGTSRPAARPKSADWTAQHQELAAAHQREPQQPCRHGQSDRWEDRSDRQRRWQRSGDTARDARRAPVRRRRGSSSYRRRAVRPRNPAPVGPDSACARRGRRGARHHPRARWRAGALALSPRWRSPRKLRSRRRAPASARAMGLRSSPRSKGSGSRTERRANSSSLLFSCTGVNSFVYLAFHGLAKCVFPDFMERNAIHRDLFHAAVVQLVALTEEIGSSLWVGHHGDHAVGGLHDPVQPQRTYL